MSIEVLDASVAELRSTLEGVRQQQQPQGQADADNAEARTQANVQGGGAATAPASRATTAPASRAAATATAPAGLLSDVASHAAATATAPASRAATAATAPAGLLSDVAQLAGQVERLDDWVWGPGQDMVTQMDAGGPAAGAMQSGEWGALMPHGEWGALMLTRCCCSLHPTLLLLTAGARVCRTHTLAHTHTPPPLLPCPIHTLSPQP